MSVFNLTELLLSLMMIGSASGLVSEEYINGLEGLQNNNGENIVIEEVNQDSNEINNLNDQENEEINIEEMVKELPVVGIGDSVMLGAVANLNELFPNGIFDGKVSRNIYGAISVAQTLKDEGKIGNPVIIGIGTNGEASKTKRDEIMNIIGEDKVCFWVTVTNDQSVHANANIRNYPEQYPNMHIIDWETISKEHPDYFYKDGIHLTPAGRKAYANAVYDAIYNYYLEEYGNKA